MCLSTRAILATLSLERLRTLAREFDAEHLWPMTKAHAVANLEGCAGAGALLDRLLFEELEKVCRVRGVDHRAYRREVLVARLLADADRVPNLGAPVAGRARRRAARAV